MDKGYLRNGQEISILKKLEDGYLINKINVDCETGDEFIEDEIYFIKEVFSNPLTEKISTEVLNIESKISELKKQKNEMEAEIKSQQELEKTKSTLYKQYSQLKRLDDFIAGKITHYVFLGWDLIIKPFAIAKTRDMEEWEKGTKLLSLFGASNGNLEWRINEYKDGSGWYKTVIPCLSYEEAVNTLKNHITESLNNLRKEKRIDSYGRFLESAQKYQIEVDQSFIDEYKLYVEEVRQKNIKKLKEELKALEEKTDE